VVPGKRGGNQGGRFACVIPPKRQRFSKRKIVSDATPAKRGLSCNVQSRHVGNKPSDARIPVQGVAGQGVGAMPEMLQPTFFREPRRVLGRQAVLTHPPRPDRLAARQLRENGFE